MPSMNLSTLNGPELRQLLDTARARGQAELSYQILQEMEARREARGRGLFRMRRGAAEPRVLDLGDPQEAEDDIPPMPSWVAPVREPPPAAVLEPKPKPKPKPVREPSPPPSRRRKAAPPAAAAVPAPEVAPAAPPPSPTPEPPRPRSVWDAEPEPLPMPTRPARERKRPGLSRPPAVFAAGMAAGVVLGVGVAGMWREAPPPAPVPVAMQTAALTPRPAPVAPAPIAAPEPAPAPEVTDASAVEASPTESTPAPSPDAADYAQEAGPALELPREPEPAEEEAAAAEAPRDACAARPTPADRTICGDPELQRLQRQLRRAYAQALDAHEERDLLRQRQLAWRDARSAVSNPDRLATLYEDRIRRLNAATEAARRAR